MRQISALLNVLRPVLPELPLTAATFLETGAVSSVEDPHYIYFGIEGGVNDRINAGLNRDLRNMGSAYDAAKETAIEEKKVLVSLQIYVDGVQVNKSGGKQ